MIDYARRIITRFKRSLGSMLALINCKLLSNDHLTSVSCNKQLKTSVLGKTGITVTELCFGALCMGPCQKNLGLEQSTELVSLALRKGINFIDTAHVYGTYKPIALAMRHTRLRPIIATKSLAVDYDTMKAEVGFALRELCLQHIDIFLLHGARSDAKVFMEREGAWRCLTEYKAKGIIRAIGISTHSVSVTKIAAERDDVDIVFPLINIEGLGILHGSREDMEAAISLCHERGKGVYLMKALGGGNLVNNYNDAMSYARSIEGSSAVALGIISEDELNYNLDHFSGIRRDNPHQLMKTLFISSGLCKRCKRCISVCPNNAVSMDNNVVNIDSEKCLTCGYCVRACPEFAIRMI